jgi:hypothetical protein
MKRASQDQELLKILKDMGSQQAQYPEELLSSRRSSFIDLVTQSTSAPVEEQSPVQDQKVVRQLRRLGSAPVDYPSFLLVVRRWAFVRRIVWVNFVSLCTGLWLAVQKRIPVPSLPALKTLPLSLLAASFAMAAVAGYLVYENKALTSRVARSQTGTFHSGRILNSDTREVRIICKPGAQPPLCLAGEYKQDEGLAYQGNGSARPAVAKDTMPGSGELHKAAYINDGLYGPGASWISNSRNSWIKIDLGKATKINTVTFGRDRLGKLSGHNPGQFVVSLAMADDVYADGNNSNDSREYLSVFKSEQAGFNGTIAGAETVTAQFTPQVARFIKITFENKGAAIDEVEAFMAQPPVASSAPGPTLHEKPPADSPGSPANQPSSTSSGIPSLPVDTATSIPAVTMVASETATPIPSATAIPTNTDIPTSTAIPTGTPVPTNSMTPVPSDTPVPPPTGTPVPPDTVTPAAIDPATPVSQSSKTDYYDYLPSAP